MALVTLDDLFVECAMYSDEIISKTSGAYTGDSLLIVNKFKTGINKAYQDITKEKCRLEITEDMTLDSDLQFATSGLTKTFFYLVKIEDSDGNKIDYKKANNGKIECPYQVSGEEVTVTYNYIPVELSGLTDVPVLPAYIDRRVLCYRGAYEYLSLETGNSAYDRSQVNLAKFNDSYEKIDENTGFPQQIEEVW